MLNETTTQAFRSKLRGQVIEPHDAGYDQARKVHNGMIHKKPKYIAYCTDVSDVKAALNFGKRFTRSMARMMSSFTIVSL